MNNIEKWLTYNEDVRLDCPDCGDVWYGEDCPTYCPTCGCTSGQGSILVSDFIKDLLREVNEYD